MSTRALILTWCSLTLLLTVCCGSARAFCFDEAGELYGINPLILRAIAKVESNNNPLAVNRNKNGSYDFGLMQINSSWAPVLGKERWNALGDACYNTMTGSWILSDCMSRYGYSWKAIGCYNSRTPDKRDRYAQLVFRQLQGIMAEERQEKKEAGVRPSAPATPPFTPVQPELRRAPPVPPAAAGTGPAEEDQPPQASAAALPDGET